MTDHTHKLATIVALDVAGFSARTEANEAKTVSQIALLRHVIEGIAKSHGGRIFNTAGDGFMLEFASALSGVNAALELADECRPRVRVGVHVGEVIVQPNGDLLGHGVNVAARLMAKAEPGSATISADVCRMIRGPLAERFVSRGPVQLDKMAETIEIFVPAAGTHAPQSAKAQASPASTAIQLMSKHRVAGAIGAAAILLIALVVWLVRPSAPGGSGADSASIAVLPFADMSAAHDQQYFSDGISEELLNVLAQVKDLRVAGRTSSFAFKGQNKDLREIGEILNVGYIVEGSIRKAGNKVRITAQLIQAKDGYHQWSNTYDRDLDDIFSVQDEIAKEIVSEMSAAIPALAAASKSLKPSERTDDISAYDRFLLARERMMMDGSKTAYEEARNLLDKAIAADPHYVPALAWRSYAEQMLSDAPGSVGTTPVAQSLPITKEYADRALAEDPQSADALFALGGYYGQVYATGELKYLDKAIDATRKAIAVRPSFPQAENDLAYYLGRKGEVAEATRIIAGVLQRDPGLRDANVLYGDYLSFMGRFDEAAAALDRWEKISPDQPDIAAMRLSMLARRGELSAAWRASEALNKIAPDNNILTRQRFNLRLAIGDGDWIIQSAALGRQKAMGATVKGQYKRAMDLLASDPGASAAAITFYVPIHYVAGDIGGVVSWYNEKIGSPEAVITAFNGCNCSIVKLVLALKDAGHKDYKSVLGAWKAVLAARKAVYEKSQGYQRDMGDIAALEGDATAARAHYEAAMDAGWRGILFVDPAYLGPSGKDIDLAAPRARMKSLINKERVALGLAPL